MISLFQYNFILPITARVHNNELISLCELLFIAVTCVHDVTFDLKQDHVRISTSIPK